MYFVQSPREVPDIIQLLQWSFQLPGTKSSCQKIKPSFQTHYKYCMKSTLPSTKYAVFNKNNCKKLDWKTMKNNYQANQYKEAPKEILSYKVACTMDSGSGQVVTNGIDLQKDEYLLDELRYVLVAVYQGKYKNKFTYRGKQYNFPCGTYTWLNGKYNEHHPYSESTTWKENFDWIKKKIFICKESGCTIL